MDGVDTVEVRFTLVELWCLRGTVRHEWNTPWDGKWPPYSFDLNERVALALADALEGKEPRALFLSMGDCLAIDYCLENEKPGAEDVLRKVVLARKRLVEGEPELPPLQEGDVDALLESVRHSESRLGDEDAHHAEDTGKGGAGDAALS